MRMRTFASFIPVAALLAVCAVAARAPGERTVHTILTNNTPGFQYQQSNVSFEACNGQGGGVWAWVYGVNASFTGACDTYDVHGSTASVSCVGADVHFVLIRNDFVDLCTSGIVPWSAQTSCTMTINARSSDNPTCRDVKFVAYSWGTD